MATPLERNRIFVFAIAAWIKRAYDHWHERLFSLVPGACLVFFFCPTALGDNASLDALPRILEQNASAVAIKYGDPDNETIYSISSENCSIDWIARNSEIGVIIHRACGSPLSLQLPLLRQIYAEFLSKDKNAPAFRTLFWGRLAPDGSCPAPQDLSLRLARKKCWF